VSVLVDFRDVDFGYAAPVPSRRARPFHLGPLSFTVAP